MNSIKLNVTQSDGTISVKEIKIDVEDFSIDEANLDGELCSAGVLLSYYGDLVAELEAQSATLKNRLAETRAIKALTLRSGGAKVTQGMVDDNLAADPEINNQLSELVIAQKDATKASNLFKAMFQRIECLKALTYRQSRQEKLF